MFPKQKLNISPTSGRVESSWNVMAHGDAREGKWRGKLANAVGIASTLHTTSEHGLSSITTADTHTSAASSRLNWRPPPGRFKWTRPFRRKTKPGCCACDVTFQLASTAFQWHSLHGASIAPACDNFALPPCLHNWFGNQDHNAVFSSNDVIFLPIISESGPSGWRTEMGGNRD